MTTYTGSFTNRSNDKFRLQINSSSGNGSKEITITGVTINSNSEATNIYAPIRYTSLDFSILTDDIDIYKGAFLNATVILKRKQNGSTTTLWTGKIIEVPQNQAFNNSVEVLSFTAVDKLTLLKSEPVDADKTGYESFIDFLTVECLPNTYVYWEDFMYTTDIKSLIYAKFNYANYIESSDSIVYKADILESILEYCGLTLYYLYDTYFAFNPLSYVNGFYIIQQLYNGKFENYTYNSLISSGIIDQSTIAQAGVQFNWQPQINSITLTGTYKALDSSSSSSSSSDTSWLYNYYIANNTQLLFNKNVSVTSKPQFLTYSRYLVYDNNNKTLQAKYSNSEVSTYDKYYVKSGGTAYTGPVTPEEPLTTTSGEVTGIPEYVIFSSTSKGVFANVYNTFYKAGQFSYQKYGFKSDAEYYCYPVNRYVNDHGFSNVINTTLLTAVGDKSLKEYITGFTEGDYKIYYFNSSVGEYDKYRRILNNYESVTVGVTDNTPTATYSQDNNSLYVYNSKNVDNSGFISLFGCLELSSANNVASHYAQCDNTVHTDGSKGFYYTGVITDTDYAPESSPSFGEKTVVYGTYGLTSILNKSGKVGDASISDLTNYTATLKESNSTLVKYPLITKKVAVESLPLKNDANSTKTLSFLISGSVDLNPYMYSLTTDSSMLSKTVEGAGAAKMLIKIDLYDKTDKLIFSSFKSLNPSTNPTGQVQKAEYSGITLECSSGNSVFNWSVKNNVGWNSGIKGSGYTYTPWQEFIVDGTTYSIYDVAYYKYTIYPVAYFEVPALKDSTDPLFPIYSYTQDIKVEIVEGWNKEDEDDTEEGDAENSETTNQVVYYWKNTVNPLVNGTEIALDNKLVTYNENMQSISSPSYDNTYINKLYCLGYADNKQTSEVFRFGQLVDQYSTPSIGCVVPLKGYEAAYKSYKYPFISTNNLIPLSFSYDAVNDINTVTLIEKKALTDVESIEL